MRWKVDGILACLTLLSCVILCIHTYRGRGSDFFGSATRAYLVYATFAVAALLLLAASRLFGWWARAGAMCIAFITAAPAVRVAPLLGSPARTPIRHSRGQGFTFEALTATEKAAWTLRAVLHGASIYGLGSEISVGADWPVPDDVRVRARTVAAVTELQATTAGSLTVCRARFANGMPLPLRGHEPVVCEPISAVSGSDWTTPSRRGRSPLTPLAPAGVDWPQYRQRVDRSGTIDDQGTVRIWRTDVPPQIRATPSGSRRFVFVGSHGGGVLSALDRATGALRWRAVLPNWIHQDAVTDGAIVAVGFGDNEGSRYGLAPSGVAVFDAASGRHRWTAFEQGSVMTSPVLSGEDVIYATARAVVRRRARDDGRLLDSRALVEGGPVMASPLLWGDALIMSVDGNQVCSVNARPLRTNWCTALPGFQDVGDIAPSIVDSTLIVSGNLRSSARNLANVLLHAPWSMRIAYPFRVLVAPPPRVLAQAFFGLSLRDGSMRWRSPLFFRRRQVIGHTSGTAVPTPDGAVIVLPTADTIVAFDPATGNVRWTAAARGSRAPLLVVDSTVLVTDSFGVLRAMSTSTGNERCRVRLGHGYDRAGPIRLGSSIIAADLKGAVLSLPVVSALQCRTPLVVPDASREQPSKWRPEH